ncbi:type I-F CRISPR-associated protein Csy2 [Vibrio algicola]|uniref:CRISPR-associated protein Csy2 n=1 Tax=Vibrio algicola TaxID=2662262 RepID=A0A5Q0TFK4_9VIBR|nr:type I-F CRISPR-associated protein Csy2 [Vibrio algicola]
MTKLSELIAIENLTDRQAALKKAFMPYSDLVEVDGNERDALRVLVNLSLTKPECKNWLDKERAKQYLSNPENISIGCDEVKWMHTHNLKFPDCRVAKQRLLAEPLICDESFISSTSVMSSLGWSHNSAVYKHTIWLLNEFMWQGNPTNILCFIAQQDEFWLKVLKSCGLKVAAFKALKNAIEKDLPTSTLPNRVDPFSKQVRFPWNNDYLSITPVVSHVMQVELERMSRQSGRTLKFTTMYFPNSPSIGNLCGSLGGNMKVLHYPIEVQASKKRTFSSSKNQTQCFFDDYQLTNAKFCKVLSHLCGAEALKTRKQRKHVRQYQLRIARKQIGLWLLPLIELRDHIDSELDSHIIDSDDPIIDPFLYGTESKLSELLILLNQRLHQTLQNNRYSSRYAYHPELLSVLKIQLKWILEQLSSPQAAPNDYGDHKVNHDEQEQYIHLSSLRVEDANAMSCPYLCGAPSLTSIWGFVHNYQRQLNQSLDGAATFEFESFAVFIRNENINMTAKLTEPSVLAAKRTLSHAKRPTIIATNLVDIEFDMVIKVRSVGRLSDYGRQLKTSLPTIFSGGALFQPRLDSADNWLCCYQKQSDVFYRIKSLPAYGVWLVPSDLQPTRFSELASILAQDDSLIPISNGYHFLEQPTLRSNSLTSLHAYAENTLGVAKRLNPIDVRFSAKDHFFKQAFWTQHNYSASILIPKA